MPHIPETILRMTVLFGEKAFLLDNKAVRLTKQAALLDKRVRLRPPP